MMWQFQIWFVFCLLKIILKHWNLRPCINAFKLTKIVFFFSFHNLHRYKWQYRGVYHERGRGRQLALATWKSPNLSANVWVSICRSNQSGSKIIFSAEFEVFNGFNNLEQNRCLTINSCMEETGLIYNEN